MFGLTKNPEKDYSYNKHKLFKNINDLMFLFKKREQKRAVLNTHVRRLEERVAKLEGQKR
jgi:hypothetical protein